MTPWQYYTRWLLIGIPLSVLFLIAVRVFLVNPLLRESEKVRAEIHALRSTGGGS